VNIAVLRDECEVAVVGAGPYGLAVAAHLKAAKVATRIFGEPMSFWRKCMPGGMKLRSPWPATSIADPHRRYTLDAHAHRLALPQGEPLPLERFLQYGEWFQRLTVPDLDTRKVVRVEDIGRSFYLVLEDGEVIDARRIVIATGLANQEFRPAAFDGLPRALVSHAGEHARLDGWRGKRVAVIGRGQSACESAALLREAGAQPELICRGAIRWPDVAYDPAAPEPAWRARLRAVQAAPSAVGPFPWNWLNEVPGLVGRLPAALRSFANSRSLRPAPSAWLKPRLDGVPVHAGRRIAGVRVKGNQVGVQLDDGLRVYDHVLLATGYCPDVSRLGLLSHELAQTVATADGSPMLGAAFESAVPWLHFVGASAAKSYGPLMQVIAGAGFAARSITQAVLAQRGRTKAGPAAWRAAATRRRTPASSRDIVSMRGVTLAV
jgi:cation diffusion facilitator CzcD-associated flavoprotein CzcO